MDELKKEFNCPEYKEYYEWLTNYNEKYKKLNEQITQGVSEEIKKSSRAPKGLEVASSETLRRVFAGLGVVIDEIRFMDATSLINGMNLHSHRKDYYYNFLKDSADFSTLLTEFDRHCTFPDKYLRGRILKDIMEGSDNSTIYRDLMVAFIARTEASPSLGDSINTTIR